MRLPARQTLELAALAIAVAISVPLVLGLLNGLHPAFDSFSHFRAHLAAALGLAAVPLLFTRLRMQGLAALALAVGAVATTVNPAGLQSAANAAGTRAASSASPVYRLLHLNLRFDNPAPEKVLSLIGRMEPDVITLNEVSPMWREKLKLLEARYPHGIACPASSPVGGVAILSRRPLGRERQPRCFEDGSLAIAGIDFGGQQVDVAALHLAWPWPFGQPAQIARLRPPLSSLGATALLAGDFNAAPWSAAAAKVARAAALAHAGRLGPTWLDRRLPAGLRSWVGLPIDQVMSKGRIAVRSARVLPEAGSDHLPVLAEFSVESPGGQAILQAWASAN